MSNSNKIFEYTGCLNMYHNLKGHVGNAKNSTKCSIDKRPQRCSFQDTGCFTMNYRVAVNIMRYRLTYIEVKVTFLTWTGF